MLRLSPSAPAMLAAFAVLIGAIQMHAAIIFGNNTNVVIAGTGGLNGIAVGYNSTNAAIPSTFNSSILVKSDGTSSSSPLNFSSAPYTNIGGSRYFVFILDSQETSPARTLSLDLLELVVANVAVWSTTEAILLNSGAPFTLTPLGNGADMAFFVPVSAFNGLGLTGSDTFIFRATHSLSDNGAEEWIFSDRGITTPVSQFGSTAPIFDSQMQIPEPSTFALALLGGGLVALRAFQNSHR